MTPVIIGESVQGDSHVRHNIEKQDNYLIIDGVHRHDRSSDFYNKLSDDVRIVSVADGHGSASCPFSKTGSQTAVNVFCDIMVEFAAKYKNDMQILFTTLNREGETAKLSQHIVREWSKRILSHHKMERRDIPYRSDGAIDAEAIWKQYGTTLLGMLITEKFIFALQLGDGDITYVDADRVSYVIEGDKILGVETHSISKPDSWKKVLTKVINLENINKDRFMYVLSTDGWVNSHASDEDFHKTCKAYFSMMQEHGPKVVEKNLSAWLSETSAMGCGDDITTVFVYYKKE
jgi:serine/threonine protein phosphatase PrpC